MGILIGVAARGRELQLLTPVTEEIASLRPGELTWTPIFVRSRVAILSSDSRFERAEGIHEMLECILEVRQRRTVW